jgi:threonine dehydrogenase-like Zn-dependent dehydrogenase
VKDTLAQGVQKAKETVGWSQPQQSEPQSEIDYSSHIRHVEDEEGAKSSGIQVPSLSQVRDTLAQGVQKAKETLGFKEAKAVPKMNALVWHGKRDVRYELVDRPEIKYPTDALIRVTATSICGSDLHFFNGEFPQMKSGDVVGHEFMGYIEELGDSVSELRRGQRVVVAFDIACGTCDYCRREEYTACDNSNPSDFMDKQYGFRTAGLFGYSHATGGYSGGQAEYVRVPWAEINCLPIPDSVPDDKALYLSDVIPTAYHACMLGQVKEGDIVGIWGLGPIGLLAARWCQILGARQIIGIDGIQDRLYLAQKSLKIDVINYHEKKITDVLKHLVPRGLDVAIDCTGYRFAKGGVHRLQRALFMESDTPEVITECVTALRKFGRLSIIADYIGNANNFPIGHIAMKHLYVASGQSPTQKYWKGCLEKLQSGEFDPGFIITHELSLSDGPTAYQKFNDHDDGCVKVLLRPSPPKSKDEEIPVSKAEAPISRDADVPISRDAEIPISRDAELPISRAEEIPISRDEEIPVSKDYEIPISRD